MTVFVERPLGLLKIIVVSFMSSDSCMSSSATDFHNKSLPSKMLTLYKTECQRRTMMPITKRNDLETTLPHSCPLHTIFYWISCVNEVFYQSINFVHNTDKLYSKPL